MNYPKKLEKRAGEILAERRRVAEGRQQRTLARLREEHPEVEEARRTLGNLQAKRAFAAIQGGADIEDIQKDLRAAQERLETVMAAAGITGPDLEAPYTCPLCGDRGVVEGGQMCECRQTVLNQLVYEQLCDVSPARDCSFENFELGYYGQRDRARMGRVLESCRRYVREFEPESRNLLFWGAPGLGKTHLSLAIAEGVAHGGHLVMYVSAPHLMDELERGKFQKDAGALELREVIFGCELLVIDDLGTELVTSFTRSEVYDLVNTRLNTGLATIINTNLTAKQLEGTYGGRVYSRIAGLYAAVEFRGRDIRLQKKQEGYR